jgi:hypothetical protein
MRRKRWRGACEHCLDKMTSSASGATVTVLPDSGPLTTLAYADALDLLLRPGWQVALVDMVLEEVTRNVTPTSERIASWIRNNGTAVLPTKVFEHYKKAAANAVPIRKSSLGELAIQETMNGFALHHPPQTGVFLFEDHKIARASFLLPDCCRKVSTRAFLLFLEQEKLISSSVEIERRAIAAGRQFSQVRFPPGS